LSPDLAGIHGLSKRVFLDGAPCEFVLGLGATIDLVPLSSIEHDTDPFQPCE
jgi:hypothetical protein